jgi:hypothetical protein
LNTLILKCRTAGDRDKLICDGQPADSRFQIFWRHRLFFEEESSDFVIQVGYLFDEVVRGLVDHLPMVIRDRSHLVYGSERIAVGIDDRLLIYDVELALEVVFLAQRNQDRPGIRA